jgi:hypothetical protein
MCVKYTHQQLTRSWTPLEIEQLDDTSLVEIFMYDFLEFVFLSSELGIQIKNKIVFN